MPVSKLIPVNGGQEDFLPANGKTFTLKELQGAVGGFIEFVYLDDKRKTALVINEEGKIHGLTMNPLATKIFWAGEVPRMPGDFIAGPAIFCDTEFLKDDDEE